MWASASRSRWPVVTPGLSSLSTSARTSAAIRPARRIRSISARDLRVTMSVGARVAVGRRIRGGRVQLIGNGVGCMLPVADAQQTGLVGVVADVAVIGQLEGQSRPDGRGRVVRTLDERRAIDAAATLALWWIGGLVVDVAGVATHPPPRQPAYEL